MYRLQLFQKAFKKGCAPVAVSTGETNYFQALNDGLVTCICSMKLIVSRAVLYMETYKFIQTLPYYCMFGIGFHGLLCDLLRRCVAGELGADETAAFFTDLTSHLVHRGHFFQMNSLICHSSLNFFKSFCPPSPSIFFHRRVIMKFSVPSWLICCLSWVPSQSFPNLSPLPHH